VAEAKTLRTDERVEDKWAMLRFWWRVVCSAVSKPFMVVSLLGMAAKIFGFWIMCECYPSRWKPERVMSTVFSDPCIMDPPQQEFSQRLFRVLFSGPFLEFFTVFLSAALPWCCIFRLMRKCCSRSDWTWQIGPLIVIREDLWTMLPFLVPKFAVAFGLFDHWYDCQRCSTRILLVMFLMVILVAACGRGARAVLPPPTRQVQGAQGPALAAQGPAPAAQGPAPAAQGLAPAAQGHIPLLDDVL